MMFQGSSLKDHVESTTPETHDLALNPAYNFKFQPTNLRGISISEGHAYYLMALLMNF
jgi:hypothetical protein